MRPYAADVAITHAIPKHSATAAFAAVCVCGRPCGCGCGCGCGRPCGCRDRESLSLGAVCCSSSLRFCGGVVHSRLLRHEGTRALITSTPSSCGIRNATLHEAWPPFATVRPILPLPAPTKPEDRATPIKVLVLWGGCDWYCGEDATLASNLHVFERHLFNVAAYCC
jgi:hypothetical protein